MGMWIVTKKTEEAIIFIPLLNIPSFILSTLQFAYLLYTQKQTSVVSDLVQIELINFFWKWSEWLNLWVLPLSRVSNRISILVVIKRLTRYISMCASRNLCYDEFWWVNQN